MKVWKHFVLALLILMLLIVVSTTAIAGNGATNGIKVPYTPLVWNPCANDGAGEMIQFTGFKHVSFHEFYDGTGAQHYTMHVNPQGLTGVGLTTGDHYRATGAANEYQFSFPPEDSILEPRIYTFEQTEPIIGKGKVANALLHEIAHVTVNANGDWIVNFDNHHFTCK